MDMLWLYLFVVLVGIVGFPFALRNKRREDALKAEIKRLLAMLTEEEKREYNSRTLEKRRSPEYKAALGMIKDIPLIQERRHYEGDLYLRDLQEFVEEVEARRAQARVDSWSEVWNSLTEVRQAAVHVAINMDTERADGGTVAYEDRIRYVEFAMNPDWVAANRGPMDHMVEEPRGRRQETAVLEMRKKLQ